MQSHVFYILRKDIDHADHVDMIDAAGAWAFFGLNGMYGLNLKHALICYLGL